MVFGVVERIGVGSGWEKDGQSLGRCAGGHKVVGKVNEKMEEQICTENS